MIIIPNLAGGRGPVTLSASGAVNSTAYSAGDLLLYVTSYNGANPGIPYGWTEITPAPFWSNIYQRLAWKVATSSSENFAGASPFSYNNIIVFKDGASVGAYGLSKMEYTDPPWYFSGPTVNLQKSDGSSFLLVSYFGNVTPSGVTRISDLPGNSYYFGRVNNTAVSTYGPDFFGQQYYGMVAVLEIKNE